MTYVYTHKIIITIKIPNMLPPPMFSCAPLQSLLFSIPYSLCISLHFLEFCKMASCSFLFVFLWSVLLRIMILRSIHAVACVSIFLLIYCWIVFLCKNIPQFVYLFTCWWAFVLFLISSVITKAAMNTCLKVFVWTLYFHFPWVNI